MNLAARLSRYAAEFRHRVLPAEILHAARRRLVDTLGCAIGAQQATPCVIARTLATDLRPKGPATLLGAGRTTAPDLAAFANGVMVRYLDFNDTYLSKEALHPSDTIPALLAAAETAGQGGAELLKAIVLSYEIICGLADAASIRDRGWDHTTYGALATAVGAGYLLGLDPDRLEQAISLAVASNITLRQIRVGQLSMWKGAAFGNAGRNGVFAALLAQRGMTGPSEIFEGPRGFMAQVSGPFDLVLAEGDASFRITDTLIKQFPAEYHAQGAIEAALAMRDQVALPAIEAVRIETYRVAVQIIGGEVEKWHPSTRETADHSLPYLVAAALADGEIGVRQFAPERICAPDLRQLMDCTTVVEDPAMTTRYPQALPVRVVVILRDGHTASAGVETPLGHKRRPMSDAQIEEKFHALTSAHLPTPRRRRLLRQLWRIEQMNSLSPVLRLCTAFPRR